MSAGENYWVAHKHESAEGVTLDTQSVYAHLTGVAGLSSDHSGKFGCDLAGRLMGNLHDHGKFTEMFRSYLLLPDGPDKDALRGTIDHATAGGQIIWDALKDKDRLVAQFLSQVVVSHHSGLIDSYTKVPNELTQCTFQKRMDKEDSRTRRLEATANLDPRLATEIDSLLGDPLLITQLRNKIDPILERCCNASGDCHWTQSIPATFELGLFSRLFLSCLLDGDRLDTAKYDKPGTDRKRLHGKYPSWDSLLDRFYTTYNKFDQTSEINKLRRAMSDECATAAERDRNIFELTVPTGGGKNLIGLRFGLLHAKKWSMKRIFFIVPFTTIIEQNAWQIKKILDLDKGSPVVLEHHSNLTPEDQTYQERLLTDNWDAPIVFTTAVQFMLALFGGGTRSARRMHQLANSVIILDEAQALGIKNTHMLSNAFNFLVNVCGCSIILSTATQPIFGQNDPEMLIPKGKGSIKLNEDSHLIKDYRTNFDKLKRVNIHDLTRHKQWSIPEVSELIKAELTERGNVLVIVNTKKVAMNVYNDFKYRDGWTVACGQCSHMHTPAYHLSTNMCPEARLEALLQIKDLLKAGIPVVCISTQLIEAGIDIDFTTVIRSSAGLDSLAQAGGRCNRNAGPIMGKFIIINIDLKEECVWPLPDIERGQYSTRRMLREFRQDLSNLFSPDVLNQYFRYYIEDRKTRATHCLENPISDSKSMRMFGYKGDTLLNLLSLNNHMDRSACDANLGMNQAFSQAGKLFRPIDNGTQGILIPYRAKGQQLLTMLQETTDTAEFFKGLKSAQRYSVNVYVDTVTNMLVAGVIHKINPFFDDVNIYYLVDESLYDYEFGLDTSAYTHKKMVDDEDLDYDV